MTYYSEHRKQCLKKSTAYYRALNKDADYKEKKAAYHKAWRTKNRESWLAKKAEYRKNNKPKIDAYFKQLRERRNPADTSMKPISIKRLGCVNAAWVWNKAHTEKLIVKLNIRKRLFIYVSPKYGKTT